MAASNRQMAVPAPMGRSNGSSSGSSGHFLCSNVSQTAPNSSLIASGRLLEPKMQKYFQTVVRLGVSTELVARSSARLRRQSVMSPKGPAPLLVFMDWK
eukprot:5153786-Ditylum_brightwellii.AAC.1